MPKSTKQLHSFLGLTNFSRHFVYNYVGIVTPYSSYQHKVTVTWSPQHHKVFDTLHQPLIFPPILDYPARDNHFVLTADASDMELGAILSTPCGTVMEYASRTPSSIEIKVYYH